MSTQMKNLDPRSSEPKPGWWRLLTTLVVAAMVASVASVVVVTTSAAPASAAPEPVAQASYFSINPNSQPADGKSADVVNITVQSSDGTTGLAGQQVAISVGSTVTASAVTDNGNGTYTATLTSTIAGSYPVTAQVNVGGAMTQIGSGSQNAVFLSTAAVAAKSSYSVDAGNVTANGSSTHTVTVNTADVNGNPTAGSVVLTVPAPAQFANGTQTTTVATDATGAGSATITSTKADTYPVTAQIESTNVPVATGGSANAVFVAGPVDLNASSTTWVVNPPSGSVAADGSSAFTGTVTLTDKYGNPITGTSVNIDVPTGVTAKNASGAALTLTGGQVTLVTGADGTATVKYTSTKSGGPYPVGAYLASGGQIGQSATLTFSANPPVAGSSTFTVDSGNVTADGSSTHTVTVNTADVNGNPSAGTVVLTVLAPAQFANGTQTTTVSTNAAGTGTATITSTKAGTYLVTAQIGSTNVPLATGGSANAVFVAGPPAPGASTSTWQVTPTTSGTVLANGTATYTGTVTLTDKNGNPVTGASINIDVPTGVTAKNASGATLTVTNGQATVTTGADGTATVTYTSTTSGNYPVGAYLAQSAGGGQIGSNQSLVFSAAPPVAANSTFTVDAGNVTADGSSTHTVTVTTKDTNGNPSAGSVALTVQAPAIFSNGTQSITVSTNAAGTGTATITSPKAGTYLVTAAIGGTSVPLAAGGTANAVFVAGPPAPGASTSTWQVTPSGSVLADGNSSYVGTVALTDANGNPVTGASINIDVPTGVTAKDGSTGAILVVNGGQATVVTGTSGTATVKYTSTTSGSYSVGAYLSTGGQIGQDATLTFVAGAVDPAKSTLVIDSSNAVAADGTTSHVVTATITDAFGNPVSGQTVTFSGGGATLSASSATTPASGQVTVNVTSTKAGSFPVTASVASGTINGGNPVNAIFQADQADPATSTLTVTSGSVVADGTHTHSATVAVKDANGNPASGSVVFTVDAPAQFSNGTQTITVPATSGSAVAPITSTKSGTYTVTATIGGTAVSGSPQQVTFAPGAAVAANSTWKVGPSGPLLANGTDTYTATVTALDSTGNPVSGQLVTMTVPTGLTGPATITTGADGTGTATYTSTVAGTYTLTASIGSNPIGSPAQLVFNSAVKPDAPVVNPSNGKTASGTGTPGDTITVTDGAGKPIGKTTVGDDGTWSVTLNPAQPDGATISAVDTNPAGVASDPTTVTVDAKDPAAPILNPSNGSSVSGTAEPGSTLTVYGPDGTPIATGTADGDGNFTIPISPQLPNGTTLTVTATDEAGNTSAPSTVTVGNSTGGKGLTPLTVDRLAGSDRYGTAAAAAVQQYPNGANVVFVATGVNFPDALAAAPAAAKMNAPVLLAEPTYVPTSTMTEMNALHPSEVVVVGQTAALSNAVVNQIKAGVSSVPTVVRVGGVDRYATSRALASFAFGSTGASTAFFTAATTFQNAEIASPAAIKLGAPLLLVAADSPTLSATTTTAKALGVQTGYLVGDTTTISATTQSTLGAAIPGSVTRVSGSSAADISIAVAEAFFASVQHVYLATDAVYPDALTGAWVAGLSGSPVFMTNPSFLSAGLGAEILKLGATHVTIMGGPAAVSDVVLQTVQALE